MAGFLRKSALTSLVAGLALLAGCGSGGPSGPQTYIVTPAASGGVPTKGLYITIASPVPFPKSFVDNAEKKLTFVDHAKGPRVCSYEKTMQGLTGQYASLNGKRLKLKVSGPNPLVVSFCAALKTSSFNPAQLGG
jgi:hypothetical protein